MVRGWALIDGALLHHSTDSERLPEPVSHVMDRPTWVRHGPLSVRRSLKIDWHGVRSMKRHVFAVLVFRGVVSRSDRPVVVDPGLGV